MDALWREHGRGYFRERRHLGCKVAGGDYFRAAALAAVAGGGRRNQLHCCSGCRHFACIVAGCGWSRRLFGQRATVSCASRHRFVLQFLEELNEASEALRAGGLVAWYGVGGVLSGTHEAMAGAIVGHGLIRLTGGLHCRNRVWNGGSNSSIIPRVKAIDRRGNCGHICGALPVEDERGGKVSTMGGEGE